MRRVHARGEYAQFVTEKGIPRNLKTIHLDTWDHGLDGVFPIGHEEIPDKIVFKYLDRQARERLAVEWLRLYPAFTLNWLRQLFVLAELCQLSARLLVQDMKDIAKIASGKNLICDQIRVHGYVYSILAL